MKCEVCQSPDVSVIAHMLGGVRWPLCAPCDRGDRASRPDDFPATPPAYVHPDSNGAFISWD